MKTVSTLSRTVFLVLLCTALIDSLNESKANPIMEPPALTEIFFSPDGWQIEMKFDEMFQGVIDNLDNFRVTGLSGWAPFNSGISVTPGDVMIVTGYDLQYPLYINPQGDEIWLEEFFNDEWYRISAFPLRFGAQPVGNAMVTAPQGEESIAMCHIFSDDPQNGWYDFWTLKEKPNTIGSSPLLVSKRANFEGYILDRDQNPLKDIFISYAPVWPAYGTTPSIPVLVTDATGHFQTDSMFCRCYDFEFIYISSVIADTGLICIEPDSTNCHTFILDTLLTSVGEMMDRETVVIENFPNPSRGSTRFRVEVPPSLLHSDAMVRIYGISSRCLDELPINLDAEIIIVNYELGRLGDPAGTLYLYTFEVNNRTVASGKMMLSR